MSDASNVRIEDSPTSVLRTGLAISGIAALVYGLGFFLFPALIWSLGNVADAGVAAYWRWPGAWLIAMGVGALSSLSAPRGQKSFYTAFAVGALIAAIAMLWAWTEYTGATWFILLPIILNVCFAAFYAWARAQAE